MRSRLTTLAPVPAVTGTDTLSTVHGNVDTAAATPDAASEPEEMPSSASTRTGGGRQTMKVSPVTRSAAAAIAAR